MNDQNALYEEYEKVCESTAIYPKALELPYLVLGLCGEAGELQEVMTIQRRNTLSHGSGSPTTDVMRNLLSEGGDVMWYAARLANFIHVNFGVVIESAKRQLMDTNAPLMLLLSDCVSAVTMEANLIAGRAKKKLRDGEKWSLEETRQNNLQIRYHLTRLVAATLAMTAAIARISNITAIDNPGPAVFDCLLNENMVKVLSRKERGTIGGDGEHR